MAATARHDSKRLTVGSVPAGRDGKGLRLEDRTLADMKRRKYQEDKGSVCSVFIFVSMLDLFYKSVTGHALYRSDFKVAQGLVLPTTLSHHTLRIPGYPGRDVHKPTNTRNSSHRKGNFLFFQDMTMF